MEYVRAKLGTAITDWLKVVPRDYVWEPLERELEIKKHISVAEMAFLDHGEPIIPAENISDIQNLIPAYVEPNRQHDFLVYQGGNFLIRDNTEIIASTESRYYPISIGTTLVLENDPYDKHRGGLSHVFEKMTKKPVQYFFSFRHRTEEEIINAFRLSHSLAFWSSYKSSDWLELLIRCYHEAEVKIPVIAYKPSQQDYLQRHNLCMEFLRKFDIPVQEYPL